MIAQVLNTQKWNSSHAGTDQRSRILSLLYSSSTFLSSARWLKAVCTKCSFQNILLPSGSIKVLKVLFSETDFLHRLAMFHSHSWIQRRKNNTRNYLPLLKRSHHSSWIFCAPHTAPWAFLGVLSNYSASSICFPHEIWQNHSLTWSSWDLTFIYKT